MIVHGKFAGLGFAAALVTAAATLISTGAPLHAAELSAPTRSIAVSHAGLDLGSAEGLKRFDVRVRQAAEALCLDPGALPLHGRRAARECIADAIASAEPQVRLAVARQRQAQFAALSTKD